MFAVNRLNLCLSSHVHQQLPVRARGGGSNGVYSSDTSKSLSEYVTIDDEYNSEP